MDSHRIYLLRLLWTGKFVMIRAHSWQKICRGLAACCYRWFGLKLAQEAQVILEQQADVGYAVFLHR